ncbi:MAG TPA: hypothetical protein VMM27_09605 [Casimicrobiaceae bacterium]|nr:hypothetical protein [Casimicrobiaceae bacterium]
MVLGIKYIAHGSATGYGMAAFAYIRALHNAGIPVWPFFLGQESLPGEPEQEPYILRLDGSSGTDADLADLPAIIDATTRPIAYDTVLAHNSPDRCRLFAEAGKRLIAYTAWETEVLPEHWPGLIGAADAIAVPSRFNAELFVRSGVTRPMHVVPHILRHAWSESAREDGVALRLRLGIPEDHFVFYTIAAWDPRKAVGELIDVFVREFGAADRVTLLVKTSAGVENAPAEAMFGASVPVRAKQIIAAASRDSTHHAAKVVCLAASEISGRMIDAIHAAGDAYVSLTHGEAWGMGAFDAASLGKPVIITGWGGQLDFLGEDYPGLVRYELTSAGGWMPFPEYRPTGRWASADRRHAAQLMRAAVARDRVLLEAASALRGRIAERYAEPVVARQLLAAINA